jgi:polyisoprenoid-binding protein YceI
MSTNQSATATRSVDSVDLPAVGRWVIDPVHTEVAFVGRHFLLTKVRGRFRDVEGVVQVAADPGDTTVEVTIGMTSVDSGSEVRDDHLRSAELFDVANHPTATFCGKADRWDGQTGQLVGELTVKGVTRPLVLDVEYLGTVADPWGSVRAIYSASGTLNRDDWGVSWNAALDAGGLLVSDEIRIEIETETVLEPSY